MFYFVKALIYTIELFIDLLKLFIYLFKLFIYPHQMIVNSQQVPVDARDALFGFPDTTPDICHRFSERDHLVLQFADTKIRLRDHYR